MTETTKQAAVGMQRRASAPAQRRLDIAAPLVPAPGSRISRTATGLFPAAVLLLFLASAAAGQDRFPRPLGHVSDHAQALAPQSRASLEQILQSVNQQLGVEFAIVTLRDLEGEDPSDYANRLYEAWGIGNRETNRGILLLDMIGAPGQSFVRVEVGYGLEGILPDGRVGSILDRDVIPHLRGGQRDVAYAAAVLALMRPVLAETGRDPAQLEQILSQGGYRTGSADSGGRGSVLGLLPLIVIALILMRSRTGRGVLLGAMIFGGMGGGGRRGGGFGGGFGGFGGGLSGGGGAGRSY